MDLLIKFWHAECVCGFTQKVLADKYHKWCIKTGYRFSESKAEDIYISARARWYAPEGQRFDKNLGPRIIAGIGDVVRFKSKSSLVCYAGLEAPPYESREIESHDRKISKKGSPHLQKVLFQVMACIIQNSPVDDPIFQFIDCKRSEGKHCYSYMNAGYAKFLHIYYARVTDYLNS